MKDTILSIARIVGDGICVSADDGLRVYEAIKAEILKGNRVILSFAGVTRLTTAFLNAAVGQLYGEYSEDQVQRYLGPPIDAQDWHLKRLKLSNDQSKIYFRNQAGAEAAAASEGVKDDN